MKLGCINLKNNELKIKILEIMIQQYKNKKISHIKQKKI